VVSTMGRAMTDAGVGDSGGVLATAYDADSAWRGPHAAQPPDQAGRTGVEVDRVGSLVRLGIGLEALQAAQQGEVAGVEPREEIPQGVEDG
jgi:hypothetical protein